MTRRTSIATELLKPINPASILIWGIFTLVWGLWVVNPFWTVFTQAAVYDVLSQVAPEAFWGLLAVTCGFATIFGTIKGSYRWLLFGSAVSFWHWFMITIFYFLGDPLTTAALTTFAIAVYSAYIYLNIKVNFKGRASRVRIF